MVTDKLNFVQLTCLISAPTSLPLLMIGDRLEQMYGAGTAISSIIIGNLILWLIAITIISMVDKADFNAIDNFKTYLGKSGGMLVALILLFAFLNWYALQINSSISELNNTLKLDVISQNGLPLRLGAALGLLIALLAIGGIRLFKIITLALLPFFICFYVYGIIFSDHSIQFKGTWSISFSGIFSTILLILPGIINLPTIFSLSLSRAHSYLALSLIFALVSFFEISTIWIKFSNFDSKVTSHLWLISIFTLLTLTCANLLNIFFASACWKSIVPGFKGGKGFAIIGLLGSLTYTFLQISSPVLFFGDLTNSYIACLGAVLILAFLIRIIVKHRPRPYEMIINMSAWLFGCLIATIYEAEHFLQGVPALLAGVNASVLFFIVVLFIEETMWAIEKKFGKIRFNK